MTTIALTGGIASGKTTISNRLRELGAIIIDADEIAREIVEPGQPTLTAIVSHFGDDILRADGSLDRSALAAIVFNDDEARRVLNDLTHPEIRRITEERIDSELAADPEAIFVHDIPLLAENRSNYDYDEIWVADAPADVRLERLLADRDMTREEAQARIDAQASDEERRRIADVVLDTTRPISETIELVDELYARLRLMGRDDDDEISYDGMPVTTPAEERVSDE
ncbi:dephospho-CoA kinase [Gulosibacter faecalis]|jgi:dephospho-CoA kinase|uniref:Dephospho-CoA kinase n=1 Tax=Gulosibacter faecalis TaxID=272240 RepID=A0ABW5UYU1_9MICO|nr:dephospho-CoA kinase [Gulosibacter faecalis]